jgi:cytochrome c oxidase subunit II
MPIAIIVWLVTAAVTYFFAAQYWWFPPPINRHGVEYDAHFHRMLIVTGAIFVLAQAVLGWLILRFRDDGKRFTYSHGSNRLELIWTSATAVLFVGLLMLGQHVWADVHLSRTEPNALRIEVLANQFAWSFRYAGADGKFARTELKLINDASGNPFGIDMKDPASKDDKTTGALRVPVGVPIELILRSRDVIHNFFVRELRIKQDVVPGMEIPLRFQADQIGEYEIPCSELCGLGHHQMRSRMIVMERGDFDRWLRESE